MCECVEKWDAAPLGSYAAAGRAASYVVVHQKRTGPKTDDHRKRPAFRLLSASMPAFDDLN